MSFLFEIFDNFLEWVAWGAEEAGPVATLRYVYAPVLRVVRQGGCLHPDTLVHTDRGTLRLRELVDPFRRGWQPHTLSVATDEGWRPSPEGYNNGVAPTLRVVLENGPRSKEPSTTSSRSFGRTERGNGWNSKTSGPETG